MDELRYFLAVALAVLMAAVIAFWAVIHGGGGFWKKRPLWMAYASAGLVMLGVVLVVWSQRTVLVGADMGFHFTVFAIGFALYVLSLVMARPIRKHLSLRTFAGVPEITDEKTDLIVSGPFEIVRHPRYLMVFVGIVGWSLMANFAGAYIIGALSIAAMMVIVRLEERELVDRFGEDYVHYQKRVPQIFPSLAGLRKLIAG